MDAPGRGLRRLASLAWLAAIAFGGSMGGAQAGTSTPTDLSLPMFATSAGDPYALNVAPTQTGPAGTVSVTQSVPLQGYGFDSFRQNIHGYVSAGVSSHGGRGVEGGVLLPIVPGKVDLELGAGTSRIGDLYTFGPRPKRVAVDVTDYHATLYVHPTDDTELTISYAGANFSQPRPVSH